MDWLALKSGSDVRGTAVGEDKVLTGEIAKALGIAFVLKLSRELEKEPTGLTITLGRDSRISGPSLLNAAAEGISSTGATAFDFGICTTPAMFMSTITAGFEADGAVMITASHHPWNKNGLKFFTKKGGLEGNEIYEMLKEAQELDLKAFSSKGEIIQKSFLPVYKQQLADRIRKGLKTQDTYPLKGLQVAVDAGNGAGGFYADLMEELGASTKGSQFLDPDGFFPNHIPNPENTDAMKSIQSAVIESGADVGVIFDADCDRAAIVDGDGKAINRNNLIALISAILLEEESGQTIVTDSVTSSGLADFIAECGGKHYRFKRGYRNVIDEALRLNREGIRCPLAIETSGHAALRENHFLDDGMYLVTVLIIRAMIMKQQNKRLGSIIANLKEPAESVEVRLNISDNDFSTIGKKTIDHITKHAAEASDWHIAPDNREGIRISFDLDGQKDAAWFLLRLSVHDPVMPLNAESSIKGGIQVILQKLYDVIKDSQGIDLSPLKQAAGIT